MSINDYIFNKSLGKGGFSKVKLAERLHDNKKVAIKIISKKSVDASPCDIRLEASILESINHTNVVKLYELLEDSNNYYIIMEYVKGNELLKIVLESTGGLDEELARKYFVQIVSAVSYCHSQFICHRDLKLENIMVDKHDHVKIIDFGFSTRMYIDGAKHNTWCGSPMYVAPEICSCVSYTLPQIDIWALGIILYAMLTSMLPFGGRTDQKTFEKIKKCKYRIPLNVPMLANNLITQILKKNPKDRISLAQIREHRWLEGTHIDLQIKNVPKNLSINLLIIEKMENLGFNSDEVMNSLRKNETNEYTKIYHDLKNRIYKNHYTDLLNSELGITNQSNKKLTNKLRGRSEPDLRSSSDSSGDILVLEYKSQHKKKQKNHKQNLLQKLFDH